MKLTTALTLLLPITAWSHGEDKPGPHNGHIRMPGAFHTELVLGKNSDAHVYLLDMEFKNPTIKDSSVQMKARSGKKEVTYKCEIMGSNHFHCTPGEKVPAKAELIVQATREKAVGNEAVYQLPLPKLEGKKSDHHNHH